MNAAYRVFPSMKKERKILEELISLFNTTNLRFEKISSLTPIQAVIVPGNEAVKEIAADIQQKGFDVRPILYPTVPAGKERLRIVIHSFNTNEQLTQLLSLLS